MKKILLLLSLMAFLFSCKKKEEECQYNTQISSPQPYVLETRGEIKFNGGVESFQFVNEQIGYAMATNNVGSYVELFKTTDGGQSWKNLKLGIKLNAIGFAFKDEQVGIITAVDAADCPSPGCQFKCVIYKTENGGASWTKTELEQYKGSLYHPQFDKDGNLFACLSKIDAPAIIIKSSDNGAIWNTFFTFSDLGFSLVTFSFKVSGDKIYASTKNGDILVLSNSGALIKTISYGDSYNIWDFEVIDENNMISVKGNKVLKTSDGGLSWARIHDKSARIIGFNNENEGLMIFQKNYCGSTGASVSNDYIAYTHNGGMDWILPHQTSLNLVSGFNGSQKMSNKLWYMMMGNTFMTLKSQ